MIVQKRQAGKLTRPNVPTTTTTTPDFPNDNSLLARLSREQHTKKKSMKPNVSAPIILDQCFSSTDEDNPITRSLPKIADIRTSYHLPTQYNSLPTANYTAMVSSHAAKTLFRPTERRSTRLDRTIRESIQRASQQSGDRS